MWLSSVLQAVEDRRASRSPRWTRHATSGRTLSADVHGRRCPRPGAQRRPSALPRTRSGAPGPWSAGPAPPPYPGFPPCLLAVGASARLKAGICPRRGVQPGCRTHIPGSRPPLLRGRRLPPDPPCRSGSSTTSHGSARPEAGRGFAGAGQGHARLPRASSTCTRCSG